MVGILALLSAGAAQAERVSEPYAKVGYWEITAENHRQCAMKSLFPGKADGGEQALIIIYEAQRKYGAITWITLKPG